MHTFCLVEKTLFPFLLMSNSAVKTVSCLSLDILRVCSGNAPTHKALEEVCVGEVGARGMSYHQSLELQPETSNSSRGKKKKKTALFKWLHHINCSHGSGSSFTLE